MKRDVLVTGGTGTFGRAYVRHWLEAGYDGRIHVLSRSESRQWEMRSELLEAGLPRAKDQINYFVGDVRDADRLRRAFEGIDTVIHAAALKRVDSCEYNPREAILTNVDGTANVIEAALDCEVPRVLLISSDKACNPCNLYGATKLCAERLIVQANSYRGKKPTKFSAVRYGNVIASTGSFVETVLKCRDEFRPIPVTQADMTRFWLSIELAVWFVEHSLTLMAGGETFVPNCKAAGILKVVDWIYPTASIEMVGKRPGEKIHETLITEEEAERTVDLGQIFVIEPAAPMWGFEFSTGPRFPSKAFSSAGAVKLTKAEFLEMLPTPLPLEIS